MSITLIERLLNSWIGLIFMKSGIFVLVLVIFVIGCAEQGTLEQTSRQDSTELVCNFDWNWYTTSHIGYYEAREGYKLAVVTIRIVNHSTIPVNANPFDWELEAEDITYIPHTATFDDSINYSEARIGQNGDLTFQLVFEIPSDVTQATLHYAAFSSPQFVRDDTLIEDQG